VDNSAFKCLPSHAVLFVSQVFTAAAADERKNVVLLAFETMEKIVREYFPHITETETMTFTDCVRCLITFTNSRFNSDVSLNAIAFLRFCAVKLADGGLVCNEKSKDLSNSVVDMDASDTQSSTDKDDHASFWVPLLTGNLLSELDYQQMLQPLHISHGG
jgi:brefeldin A-inhibited guanine nucleotide-exchange protein